ncbi:MAG TPA: hypothetical protein VFP50_00195, partial [Anaeromyxobacteraceae bacterium]|nr:hypothetical protein [Anaeromyxobacteraceae bacterium]
MPSADPAAPPPAPAAPPRDLSWLRSQGLGLVCGFGTVILLAVGSVVLAATRDGASAGVALDDLTAFFTRPSWAHLWLYLLFPLAGLFALNTTLATWENAARRWRAGQRSPAAYAAAVVHVGFLLALVAHGVGGFRSEERGAAVVTSAWQPLPGFGEVRLTALDVDELPNGMPRSARAALEVRRDGRVEPAEVGYNQPLTAGLGARLALLQELGRAPVARLVSGAERCELAEGQGCAIAGQRLEVTSVSPAPGGGGAALVRAAWAGGQRSERWLAPGGLLV